MGSSAAAVVAGLLIGAAEGGAEPDRERLLALAVGLEGHPDNCTPALLGGCTLSLPAGEEVAVVRQPVHDSLGFAVAWPSTPVATREGRDALPESVPFADAVENPRRLALLLEGLRTGNPRWLALGSEDRLHQAYRLPLIPNGREALAAARAHGAHLATVSGSGSALFAIGPRDGMDAVAEALAAALAGNGGEATGRVVELVADAPRVVAG